MGPNFKKLMIQFATKNAIPKGGSFVDGVKWIREKMQTDMAKGKQEAQDSIQAIREAREPNPYRAMSDEEIAGVILEEIEKRKQAK